MSQKKDEKKEDMLNFAEIERSIMGNENHKHLVARVNEKAQHYISVKKKIFFIFKTQFIGNKGKISTTTH